MQLMKLLLKHSLGGVLVLPRFRRCFRPSWKNIKRFQSQASTIYWKPTSGRVKKPSTSCKQPFEEFMISSGPSVKVANHPLIQHTLTRLRDYQTPSSEFRRLAIKLGEYLVYEAMNELTTRVAGVETPIGPAKCKTLSDYVILAPILRAGLLLAEGAQHLLPTARIYHIGLKRDENTLQAVSYYTKL